jgi:16S rRNA (adenine1518-N6/adenine1519-N6)-dimethyltransferase
MIKAKKHLGQNFLHDTQVINKIIAVLNLLPTDHVVEIGPGLGALTHAVLPIIKKIDVVELDADVIPHLQQQCRHLGELTVHHKDALQFDFHQFTTTPLRIIGNLPYNISSPLLFHLLRYTSIIQDMHFMLQKEVVSRMAATPGSRDYGRLSVMLQYHCQVKFLFEVPPSAFRPAPKVDSAFVRLIPYTTLPHPAQNYEQFSTIVKAAFSQRRKTIRNCLKTLCDTHALLEANIDPQARAETLTVHDFVRLANGLNIL